MVKIWLYKPEEQKFLKYLLHVRLFEYLNPTAMISIGITN